MTNNAEREWESQSDTHMKDRLICPHCGYVEKDAWEIDFGDIDGDTNIACASCGEEYLASRMAVFYYSTEKVA
jgi:ribosomal protein S27AE